MGAVVLYAVLGFLLAPYLLERTLVNTLRDDYGASLSVENIDINPFALSLRVKGLALDNPAGEPTARIGELFANFQLSSMFRLALTFDEIRISSPQIFAARDKAGDFDFDYLLPAPEEEKESVPTSDEDAEESSLLALLVFNFAIDDFVINWTDNLPIDPVQTRLGPISIAINELNTLPERSGQQTVVIATENSGLLSWSGDLQLNPLYSSGRASVENTRFPVISSYIRRQAGIEIADGRAHIDMDYEVSTRADGDLEASISNFNLTLEDIVLRTFSDDIGLDFAGEDQQFLALPRFRLTGGELRWPEQTLALGSIAFDQPQIDVSRDPNGVFSLEPRSKGDATQAPADEETEEPGKPWQVTVDQFAVNGLVLNLVDQTVEPAVELGVSDFNLEVDDLDNQPGTRFPTRLGLQVASGGKLALEGEFAVLPVPVFDFKLDVDGVQLTGLQPYVRQQANLNLDSGAINLAGQVSGTSDDPFAFAGDFQLVDLVVAESIGNERLASWKDFTASRIAFSTAGRQLEISQLRFEQPYGDVLINEDGSLNVGQVKKTSPTDAGAEAEAPPTEPAETDSTDEDGFTVRIGDIAVVDASADFADLSLPLPFATKIHSLNGKITTVATDSSAPSEVSLEGSVDDYGFARISGTVTPLDPAKNTDLVVAFENIDVPSFTPYSIPIAGRKVESGNLDLQLGYKVTDSELQGENSIVLRDFELGEKVPHPDAMSLPLDLAIALLKDVDGKIAIDLPVRGNVDDPEFSYGSVIWQAIGTFLTKIIVSPFAALGNMLGMEASELEYVKFIEGRADLTPPEREKADTLAEALAQRPELRVQVSGVFVAEADGLALRQARVDKLVDLGIAELAADGDSDTQYAEMRLQVLERLFREQLAEENPDEQLEALQQQFTTTTTVEGQTGASTSMDSLAYTNALRDQLVERQVIEAADLAGLASSRAEAFRSALLATDTGLQERITIAETVELEPAPGEPIQMRITLTAEAE